MNTGATRTPTQRSSPLVTALLLLFLASTGAAQVHVARNGSSAPDGSAGKPYQEFAAGVCAAKTNEMVVVRGGAYPETITIRRPVTLTASAGSAVIGRVTGKGRTTLKLVTYNTHLFGGKLGGLETLADETRARAHCRPGSR